MLPTLSPRKARAAPRARRLSGCPTAPCYPWLRSAISAISRSIASASTIFPVADVRRPRYARAIWPSCSSTPSSEHSSATCSTSSVPRHRPSSSRGRPAISPRTSSCASTTASPDPGSSCPARGAASPNNEEGRSRVRDFLRARRDDPIGTAARLLPHRMGAPVPEPQRVLRPPRGRPQSQRSWSCERTSMRWTRRCGATSVGRPGSSHGDCAAPDSSFSGRGPLRTVRARRGEPTARIVGPPGELLLYLFGRQGAAHVEVSGPAAAVEAVRRARFGM